VGHKERLSLEEVGMGAGEDLGGGPVELIDGGVVGGKACIQGDPH